MLCDSSYTSPTPSSHLVVAAGFAQNRQYALPFRPGMARVRSGVNAAP